MKKQLSNLLNGIACRLLPTEELQKSKTELEEYIAWGKNGEIEASQEDIADSEEQLVRVNKTLNHRSARVG